MKSAFLVLCVGLLGLGCATDDPNDDARGGGEGGGTSGTPGSTGGQEFGNSTAPQAPPLATNASISGGGCEAGHYIGSFSGTYLSPAAFELFPVPIEAVDLVDPLGQTPPLPGFEFWLEAAGEGMAECSVDDEFCFDFQVKGGIVRGQANGLFPFEVELVGDLDCSKGIFKGTLQNGWYDAFGTKYQFEGWMDSSYDSTNKQFFDGTWAVTEPAGTMAGGEGTWYAGWVMDTP